MKFIKLLLIALLAAGVVVGLLLLSRGTSGPTSGGEDDQLFKKTEEFINAQWKDATHWDLNRFDESMAELHQKQDKLRRGYRTLVDIVGKHGSQVLYDDMIAEFAKSNCSYDVVTQYDKDRRHFLHEISDYASDQKLVTLKGTYSLYTSVLDFGRKYAEINVAPDFNMEEETWKDYNAYERSVKSQRENLTKNVYFPYIKNINDVNNALSKVDAALVKGRDTFKNKLARQIIDAFNNEEPNGDTHRKLNRLNRNFLDTFGAQSELSDYVLNYSLTQAEP